MDSIYSVELKKSRVLVQKLKNSQPHRSQCTEHLILLGFHVLEATLFGLGRSLAFDNIFDHSDSRDFCCIKV